MIHNIQQLANELLHDLPADNKSEATLEPNKLPAMMVLEGIDKILQQQIVDIYTQEDPDWRYVREDFPKSFDQDGKYFLQFPNLVSFVCKTHPNGLFKKEVAQKTRQKADAMLLKLGKDDNFLNSLIGKAVLDLSLSTSDLTKKVIKAQFTDSQGALSMFSYLKANKVTNWYLDPIGLAIQGNRKPRNDVLDPISTKFGLKIDPLSANMTLLKTYHLWAQLLRYGDRATIYCSQDSTQSKLEETLVTMQRKGDPNSFMPHTPVELFVLKVKDVGNIWRHILHYQILSYCLTNDKLLMKYFDSSPKFGFEIASAQTIYRENMSNAMREFSDKMTKKLNYDSYDYAVQKDKEQILYQRSGSMQMYRETRKGVFVKVPAKRLTREYTLAPKKLGKIAPLKDGQSIPSSDSYSWGSDASISRAYPQATNDKAPRRHIAHKQIAKKTAATEGAVKKQKSPASSEDENNEPSTQQIVTNMVGRMKNSQFVEQIIKRVAYHAPVPNKQPEELKTEKFAEKPIKPDGSPFPDYGPTPKYLPDVSPDESPFPSYDTPLYIFPDPDLDPTMYFAPGSVNVTVRNTSPAPDHRPEMPNASIGLDLESHYAQSDNTSQLGHYGPGPSEDSDAFYADFKKATWKAEAKMNQQSKKDAQAKFDKTVKKVESSQIKKKTKQKPSKVAKKTAEQKTDNALNVTVASRPNADNDNDLFQPPEPMISDDEIQRQMEELEVIHVTNSGEVLRESKITNLSNAGRRKTPGKTPTPRLDAFIKQVALKRSKLLKDVAKVNKTFNVKERAALAKGKSKKLIFLEIGDNMYELFEVAERTIDNGHKLKDFIENATRTIPDPVLFTPPNLPQDPLMTRLPKREEPPSIPDKASMKEEEPLQQVPTPREEIYVPQPTMELLQDGLQNERDQTLFRNWWQSRSNLHMRKRKRIDFDDPKEVAIRAQEAKRYLDLDKPIVLSNAKSMSELIEEQQLYCREPQIITGKFQQLFVGTSSSNLSPMEVAIQTIYNYHEHVHKKDIQANKVPKVPLSMLKYSEILPQVLPTSDSPAFSDRLINIGGIFAPRMLWLKTDNDLSQFPAPKEKTGFTYTNLEKQIVASLTKKYPALKPIQVFALATATKLQEMLFSYLYSAAVELMARETQYYKSGTGTSLIKRVQNILVLSQPNVFNVLLLQLLGAPSFYAEDIEKAVLEARKREVYDYEFSSSHKLGICALINAQAERTFGTDIVPKVFVDTQAKHLAEYIVSTTALQIGPTYRSQIWSDLLEVSSEKNTKGLYLVAFTHWMTNVFIISRTPFALLTSMNIDGQLHPGMNQLYKFLQTPNGAVPKVIADLMHQWCESSERHNVVNKTFIVDLEDKAPLMFVEVQMIINCLLPKQNGVIFYDDSAFKIYESHLNTSLTEFQYTNQGYLAEKLCKLSHQLVNFLVMQEATEDRQQLAPQSRVVTLRNMTSETIKQCKHANEFMQRTTELAWSDNSGLYRAKKLGETLEKRINIAHKEELTRELLNDTNVEITADDMLE